MSVIAPERTSGSTENDPGRIFASYVLHLWSRSWLILLCTVIAAGVAWQRAKSRAIPVYTASALVFVEGRKNVNFLEVKRLTPVTYKQILLSEDLLNHVRAELAQPKDGKPPIQTSVGGLQGALSVITEMEVDTTVERTFSPVMTLSCRWGTAQDAERVLDAWLRNMIMRHGDLQTREIRVQQARIQRLKDETAARMKELVGKETEYGAKMHFALQMLMHKQNLLAPVAAKSFRENEEVQMPLPARPGVLGQLTDLRVELAGATNPEERSSLERKLAALEIEEKRLRQEINTLQAEFATLDQAHTTFAQQIASTDIELKQYTERLAELTAAAGPAEKPSSPYQGVDIRVIAQPITPEGYQIADSKMKVAMAAAAAFCLLVLLCIAEKYLKDIRRYAHA